MIGSLFLIQTSHQEDDHVSEVFKCLNQSEDFRKLKNTHQRVRVYALSKRECEKEGIVKSVLRHKSGTFFDAEKTEIIFDCSMSFTKRVQGVLVQYCNLSNLNSFVNLNERAKKGNISENEYCEQKQLLGYESYKKFVQIAQTIDNLQILSNEKLTTQYDLHTVANLQNYRQMCQQAGYTAEYKKAWNSLTSNS